MGILRTILAIAVVVFHSYKIFGLRMAGGQVAVQSFYIISGFYMAFILNEKYLGKGSYKLFITNRLLRIYPVYWIILAATFLMSMIGYYGFNTPYYFSSYIQHYSCLPPGTLFYFIIENILLLGQDVLLFLGLDQDCHLFFSHYPFSLNHIGFHYLLIPQAWSVSLELMFYILAPFIVRKHWTWQLLLVIAGLCARYYVVHVLYLSFDPWTYRVFPLELSFFIAGSMMYALYKKIELKKIPSWPSYILLCFCITAVFLYDQYSSYAELKMWVFYILVALSVPFIFCAFRYNKADRWIGELSFSIYISHHIILMAFHKSFFTHPSLMSYYGYTVVFFSIALALVVNKLMVEPLNKRRERRLLS